MALSHEASARAFAVGKNPVVARTLTALLDLEEHMEHVLRAMTIGEAMEIVRQLPAQPPLRAHSTLSERELEVVRLVAEGLSNKEISSRLKLSDKTVKNHISHILAKMNLNARTQVAVYAIRAGLV